jgi:hypothetical protein
MPGKKSEKENSRKRFRPSNRSQSVDDGVFDAGIIDASPGDARNESRDKLNSQQTPDVNGKLKNLTEHKVWQQSTGALGGMWARYLQILRSTFANMPLERQVQLIINACQIVSVGLTVLGLCFIYRFLPLFARVLVVPIAVGIAWWFGTKTIASVILQRYSKYFNHKF